MCFQDSSETCTRPSTPPRSTNAPKLTIDDTTPLRIAPFCSWLRNSLRTSDCVCSSQARRDSTTLFRFLSSSMILASSSLPMYGCRSRTRRISTSDAGRKPRRPMSRIRPPLTTSMTVPLTASSLSLSSSIVPHARSYWARFLDRISRPSLSSLVRTRASTLSPTDTTSLGSTSCLMDSSREGMTPSVLADVEEHLVPVHFDDRPFDDVAIVEVLDRFVYCGEKVLARAYVVDGYLRRGDGGTRHIVGLLRTGWGRRDKAGSVRSPCSSASRCALHRRRTTPSRLLDCAHAGQTRLIWAERQITPKKSPKFLPRVRASRCRPLMGGGVPAAAIAHRDLQRHV